ncbi:MAG: enoyl-CoA hydratase/isomerase family protein [Desulfosalsimonadaceae bacterium]|nr:enoyl-CoA hydratase/isomerase family protein [Desulfosalsimonadaceae bacterium]
MSKETIHLERRDAVAILTMDRPLRRNAFNDRMFEALERVTRELKEHLPRAIVITGGGDNAFCAGFDIHPDNPLVSGLIDAVEKKNQASAHKLIHDIRKIVDGFVSLPVPIIAAINGLAYGGGAELAVRCDLRVMDPNAVICFSEVRLGLMPDWGGGAALARLIGASRAADVILTARQIQAGEAINFGLVNRICQSNCLEEAVALADMIAANSPRAVSYTLALIRQSRNLTLNQTLDLEAEKAISLIGSGEYFYGVSAFLEKRKPEFPDFDPGVEGA